MIIAASSEVSLFWGGPHSKPSLGPCSDNVIIPLDLTQLSCPSFVLAAGLPSNFTTDRVGCWGGALWKAYNLTSFSPCLTGPVDYPLASRHKDTWIQIPWGGTYVKPEPSVSVVSLQASVLSGWCVLLPPWGQICLLQPILGLFLCHMHMVTDHGFVLNNITIELTKNGSSKVNWHLDSLVFLPSQRSLFTNQADF
jgi:hypothetical protein